MTNVARTAWVAVALGCCIAGCSHANFNPVVDVSPSPSSSGGGGGTPSPTPTPANVTTTCATPAPGAVFIAAGSYIEPTADPTYGTLYGYSLYAADGNSYPLTSSALAIKPNDTVQFVNVDPPTETGSDGNSHSATGFQTAGFPATPHVFSSAAFTSTGSAIGNSTLWSTGEIASQTDICYSQSLLVPASGTYYFGDLDFYNSVNMRGVIVVNAGAAQ